MRCGLVAAAVVAAFLSSGCAVYMAANQPSEKNVSLLVPGTPRSMVVAEFGAPVTSETKNGARHEVIKFTQGYSAGARAGRAILHGAADVATMGLWEAVGTPVEGHFNGTEMSAEIIYDQSDRVAQVIPLGNGEEMRRQIADATVPRPVETGSVPKPPQAP